MGVETTDERSRPIIVERRERPRRGRRTVRLANGGELDQRSDRGGGRPSCEQVGGEHRPLRVRMAEGPDQPVVVPVVSLEERPARSAGLRVPRLDREAIRTEPAQSDHPWSGPEGRILIFRSVIEDPPVDVLAITGRQR